jgi:hypothetical protein
MTYLIAGSILLILASAVSLGLGWVGANETLIWVSILASVGAAVCLALAYYRSKSPSGKVTQPPTGDR